MSENSISVIVPALNEEKTIGTTVETITRALKRRFVHYEILIFDDGSTDRTGEIVEKLASTQECIRVFHHQKPICLGGVFKEGIKVAKMNYVIRINGKHDINAENLDKIFALCEARDLVIPYMVNARERTLFRRYASKAFTMLLNAFFGLRLKYYNHYVLCKRSALNAISLRTDSYAFQAEILIKLIKLGASYIEVPVTDTFEKNVKTKAFSLTNMTGVVLFVLRLLYEINVKKSIEKNDRMVTT